MGVCVGGVPQGLAASFGKSSGRLRERGIREDLQKEVSPAKILKE